VNRLALCARFFARNSTEPQVTFPRESIWDSPETSPARRPIRDSELAAYVVCVTAEAINLHIGMRYGATMRLAAAFLQTMGLFSAYAPVFSVNRRLPRDELALRIDAPCGCETRASSPRVVRRLLRRCSGSSRTPELSTKPRRSLLTNARDDARVRIRTAVDAKGQLVARQATIHLNTGAYAETVPWSAERQPNRIVGPYRIPNVKIDCLAVVHKHGTRKFLSRIGRRAGDVSRRIPDR